MLIFTDPSPWKYDLNTHENVDIYRRPLIEAKNMLKICENTIFDNWYCLHDTPIFVVVAVFPPPLVQGYPLAKTNIVSARYIACLCAMHR